jgi:fibro-slime domain-containing protein
MLRPSAPTPVLVAASLACLLGCSAGGSSSDPGISNAPQGGSGTATGGQQAQGGAPSVDPIEGLGGFGGAAEPPPVAVIEETLPEGFTAETAYGGWKIVGPLADYEEPSNKSCANVLRAVARDFTQAHIDFGEEKPKPWKDPGLYQGQVLPDIGADRKPVINPNRDPTNVIEKFDDWYRSVEGVNAPYVMDFWLQPDPNNEGFYLFDSENFFPLDQHNLWPDDVQKGGSDDKLHNFLFTIELHTAFEYKGGEVFTFRGDDDVFVFINGKLAVDIGGIHGPIEGSVNLDEKAAALGITKGNVYTLDLFQAERNPTGSNFRIETSLDFKECGVLDSDIIR